MMHWETSEPVADSAVINGNDPPSTDNPTVSNGNDQSSSSTDVDNQGRNFQIQVSFDNNELFCKVEDVIELPCDDFLDEMSNRSTAQFGRIGNKCDWEVSYAVCDEGSEADALAGHDLNRITPKGFLKSDAARQAIIKELIGLTRPNSGGMPALEVVNGYEPRYQKLPRNRSAIVMRKNTPVTFKARLVSRGDLISTDEVAFFANR